METPFRRSTDLPPTIETQPIFFPKIISTLKDYNQKQFTKDVTAGVIVGIVALPLAIAFGIASGVTPERGIITAIIAGFLISAFGGSRVQIGGPTGAFVVIIYGIVEKYGINGLILCTLMAGCMLVLMGVFRLGNVIKFIPYPLTVGFTAGIAVVIFSSQIKDLFGLQTGQVPGDFVDKWQLYFQTFSSFSPATLTISFFSMAILLVWPKFNRKIPGSIVAIVLMSAIVYFFKIPVETIGSRFGSIPTGLPTFLWPQFSFAQMKILIAPAFTVAMLGAIESLLSATVADSMIEGRHRSNTELIGQGIANIVTSLFGGIPATGAIARTATNVRNGARTPVAGMVHAFTLLSIVLVFGNLANLIPMCVLASILVVVSYYMSEYHAFLNLMHAPKMDIAVLVVTFLLTVLVDLTVAVEIGMLLSLILFMKRMTDVSTIRRLDQEFTNPMDEKTVRDQEDSISIREVPEGVDVYEAEGALFFGVASTLRDHLHFGKNPPKVLVFRMKHVHALDASGIRALSELDKVCRKFSAQLVIVGLSPQPKAALERAGVLDQIGRANIFQTIDQAIVRSYEILQGK